jgi:hypothetical protein
MYRKSLLIAALVPLLVTSLPNASYSLSLPVCNISGTASADRITGTPGDDVICGGSGNDVISGLGGNDIIYGGPGNDRILGGTGKDVIYGEAGNDNIDGGDGADKLVAGDGTDRITGGNDQDLLQGGPGTDSLSAGSGADIIDGGKGKDTITSGLGNDICNADSSDVRLDACSLDSKGPKFGPLPMVVRQLQAGTLAVFTVNVSDIATVDAVYGSIGGAPGWITEWCGFRIPTELVSGSEKSGTYKLSCTIPPSAVNDYYTLFLGAVDIMGHTAEQRIAFEVVGGSSDNRPPTVTKLDLPDSVSPGENFVIRVEVTDDSVVAGIDFWLMLDVEAGSFQDENGPHAKGSVPRVIRFTPTDSIFEQDYSFRDNARVGTYKVWVGVRDGVGNRDFYDTGRSIALVK